MLFRCRSSLSCLCDLQRPRHGIGNTEQNLLFFLGVKAFVVSWADQQPAERLRMFMPDNERDSHREDAVLTIAVAAVPQRLVACAQPGRNIGSVNSMCCLDRITHENSNVRGRDSAGRSLNSCLCNVLDGHDLSQVFDALWKSSAKFDQPWLEPGLCPTADSAMDRFKKER